MKTKPTEEQITAEIAALKELLPRIRAYSRFGDDNRAALEAQIDVLSERMSLDDVHARFGEDAFIDEDEFEQCALDEAITAHDWMAGQLADDMGTPSDSWRGLST